MLGGVGFSPQRVPTERGGDEAVEGWTREDWYYEINLALDLNVWFILKVTEIVETNFFPTNAYAKEGFDQSNYKINI